MSSKPSQAYNTSHISHPRCSTSFLITDCPRPDDSSISEAYIPILQEYGVTHVLRLCDPKTYDAKELKEAGVEVVDWPFEDGTVPPPEVITQYRTLLQSLPPSSTIAVHCVSGIGRAPILVACALIDAGVDPIEAVELVRSKRRGALNKKQLAWLIGDEKGGFKPLNKKKSGGFLGGLFGKKK
ncbi:hypothetical protein HK104_002837 [Borealophlyctis nickersoniae]|nr:hypothetical protein HK104_002837 [Borealophlyctis nickersoniae]